jgi:hypothetical protein
MDNQKYFAQPSGYGWSGNFQSAILVEQGFRLKPQPWTNPG